MPVACRACRSPRLLGSTRRPRMYALRPIARLGAAEAGDGSLVIPVEGAPSDSISRPS